jgi:hypothetical protein
LSGFAKKVHSVLKGAARFCAVADLSRYFVAEMALEFVENV